MLLLMRLLESGVITIADAYTHPRGYVRPSDHGFETDRQHLIGDVRQLGSDMRGAMKKHGGKQSYKSTSNRAARTSLASAHDDR